MIQYDFRNMLTTGKMAKCIGVDRRTLISWVDKKIVPVYLNPANRYRYFDKREVINALGLNKRTQGAIDVTDQNE